MDDPLFAAPRLVVHEAFGRASRLLAKALRRVDLEEHHTITDEGGQLLARVRPRRRLLPSRDRYRLDVLDPNGVALLSLHAKYKRLHVHDANGREIGRIEKTNRSHASVLTVAFSGPEKPPQRRGFISTIERDVLGSIRPRRRMPREAFGEVEILDAAGAFAARAVNDDGRHDIIDIRADLADPLRTLVVAFACSLGDRRWLRWEPHDAL